MTIRVLFFGLLKDITGCAEENCSVPEGSTAGSLFDDYARRFPGLAGLQASILLSVNQTFAQRGQMLSDGDEVAFLPPVSGGSGGHHFALAREPIDGRALASLIVRPSDGAVVVFHGITRDNTRGRRTRHLEYECYEGMALKVMTEIGTAIAGKHAISRIGIVHRLGRLEIGEASVVIVVAAAHRKPAFAACEDAIDTLKKRVPIWKKEFFEDGEVWVEGAWDESLQPR